MTVQAADVRGHMARILNDETRLLQSLEALLQQETAVVRGDDIDAIERIGQVRHDCMAALTRLEAERTASCRMLSFGEGRGAFERLLEWCDADRSLRAICWTASAILIGYLGGFIAGLHAPLPTLRRHPHRCLRITRGRRDSPHSHREGLPPPTPCRSPGAPHRIPRGASNLKRSSLRRFFGVRRSHCGAILVSPVPCRRAQRIGSSKHPAAPS